MKGESLTRMPDHVPWKERCKYHPLPVVSALSSPYAETIVPRNSLRFRIAEFFRSLWSLLTTPLW